MGACRVIGLSSGRVCEPSSRRPLSVFAVLDEPLADLLGGRFASFRTVYLPTVGRLEGCGFELLPTAQRPHFTVRLRSADDQEFGRLLGTLGVPRPNTACPRGYG
jgi:hypothetical protein